VLLIALDGASGFTFPTTAVYSAVSARNTIKTTTKATILFTSSNGKQQQQSGATDDDENNGNEQQQKDGGGGFNWLEEWAIQGKEAVALMQVQERTQRAMLAQLTEDRIYEITQVLDGMVDETTGGISEANLPRAKELALETRNLQKEYKDLVTGEPSTLLQTFASLKLSDDDNDKKKD